MGCEICGRNSCTRSFHSLEEQSQFDSVADSIKERMKDYIKDKLSRLPDHGKDLDRYLIDLSDAIELVDNY